MNYLQNKGVYDMANVKAGHKRKELILPIDDLSKIEYWANVRNQTVSEFLNSAASLYIKFINEDYDIPTLEQQRLNQLIDAQDRVSVQLQLLEKTVKSSIATMVRSTNGRNYLENDID